MITGDNTYTGIYIAREAGIIPTGANLAVGHLGEDSVVAWSGNDGKLMETPSAKDLETRSNMVLAMTGTAWQVLLSTSKEYAVGIAPFIHVFGRCSPHDKVSVVDTCNDLGFKTLMCGDGGNDCGALKAAHVGIALSDSELSLVAPFTSLDKNLSSVLHVLREGRCTLASTIAAFKYVIMYGFISSYSQVITYYLKVSFTDYMWAIIDGLWTLVFAITIPLAVPAVKLSVAQPSSSLLGRKTVSSILGVVFVNCSFMAIGLLVLSSEGWYQCRKWSTEGVILLYERYPSDNYETEVIFLIAGFQCLASAMAYKFGFEFRRNWWRNHSFVVPALLFTFIHFYAALVPGDLSCFFGINCVTENTDSLSIPNSYSTNIMPVAFRFKLLSIMVTNGLAIAGIKYVTTIRSLRKGSRSAEEDKERARAVGQEVAPTPIGEQSGSNSIGTQV